MMKIRGFTENSIGHLNSYSGEIDINSEKINRAFSDIESRSGQIFFYFDPEPDNENISLEIQADSGKYLIMLLENDEEIYTNVRSYIDKEASSEKIRILGND